jgi:hypothetical protein
LIWLAWTFHYWLFYTVLPFQVLNLFREKVTFTVNIYCPLDDVEMTIHSFFSLAKFKEWSLRHCNRYVSFFAIFFCMPTDLRLQSNLGIFRHSKGIQFTIFYEWQGNDGLKKIKKGFHFKKFMFWKWSLFFHSHKLRIVFTMPPFLKLTP